MLPCNAMPVRHTESTSQEAFGGAAFEKVKITINNACRGKGDG